MDQLDFARLFKALPSPFMVLDRNLNFVAVNTDYERATMRPESAYVGRHVFEMFPNEGESGRRLRASFTRVLETGETDTIAYLPYDIPRPAEKGGGFDVRYWTAIHTPILDKDDEVAFIVQNTVDVTEIARLKEVAGLPFRMNVGEVRLIERAQQADRLHDSLLSESEDFRRLFQEAPGFIAVLSGPEHSFTFANDAYLRLIGDRNLIGLPVAEALPEVVGQGFVAMLDGVYATGKSAGGQSMRVMLQRVAHEPPEETFLDFSYDPVRDREGKVTGVFVQGMDRTEAVRTQQRQRMLLDELNHRVKNTLATVQSIASQTLRSATDLDRARKDFESRLLALSKAHNLLSSRSWESAELGQIICQELHLHGSERISAEGPTVTLNPKAAIAFAMLVHEMTTNAAKYGALSGPEGSLEVRWTVGHDGGLSMEWKESGGPRVERTTRRGFGSRMIAAVVSGELGGSLHADADPSGYRYRVSIPAASLAKIAEVSLA